MIRAIVLTITAVLGITLTKRRRSTRRDSLDEFEMSADNLKADRTEKFSPPHVSNLRHRNAKTIAL
jgi:hypothetical protein